MLGKDVIKVTDQMKPASPGIVEHEDDGDEPAGAYSTVAHDAIRQWYTLRARFEGYIRDGDLASRDARLLYDTAAKARDHEQDAIEKLRSYGFASGVPVPGIGRVSVRDGDDGMLTLVVDPDGAPAGRTDPHGS